MILITNLIYLINKTKLQINLKIFNYKLYLSILLKKLRKHIKFLKMNLLEIKNQEKLVNYQLMLKSKKKRIKLILEKLDVLSVQNHY